MPRYFFTQVFEARFKTVGFSLKDGEIIHPECLARKMPFLQFLDKKSDMKAILATLESMGYHPLRHDELRRIRDTMDKNIEIACVLCHQTIITVDGEILANE